MSVKTFLTVSRNTNLIFIYSDPNVAIIRKMEIINWNRRLLARLWRIIYLHLYITQENKLRVLLLKNGYRKYVPSAFTFFTVSDSRTIFCGHQYDITFRENRLHSAGASICSQFITSRNYIYLFAITYWRTFSIIASYLLVWLSETGNSTVEWYLIKMFTTLNAVKPSPRLYNPEMKSISHLQVLVAWLVGDNLMLRDPGALK